MADQQENSQPTILRRSQAKAVDVQVLLKARQLLPFIEKYPDFPKPGILFR